jgi:hypothetical protein
MMIEMISTAATFSASCMSIDLTFFVESHIPNPILLLTFISRMKYSQSD